MESNAHRRGGVSHRAVCHQRGYLTNRVLHQNEYRSPTNFLMGCVRTVEIVVTNDNVLTAQAFGIDHCYDAEHEFLETGVSEDGRVTRKIFGE